MSVSDNGDVGFFVDGDFCIGKYVADFARAFHSEWAHAIAGLPSAYGNGLSVVEYGGVEECYGGVACRTKFGEWRFGVGDA